MSDVEIGTPSTDLGGYPNSRATHVSAPTGLTRNRSLVRGRIYSVDRKQAAFDGADVTLRIPGQRNPRTVSIPSRPEISTTLFKDFQFNPPDLYMHIGMAPTEPDDAAEEGGKFERMNKLGVASTGIDLLFDRTLESNNGRSQWWRLGVAKDILDVYGVIRGDEELLKAQSTYSLSKLTSDLTDLVAGGNVIQTGMVAVQYSEDFILYGLVVGMNFRFVKFNHKLIPTMGHVRLDIDIHSTGNTSMIRNSWAVVSGAGTPNTGGGRGTVPSSVQLAESWGN